MITALLALAASAHAQTDLVVVFHESTSANRRSAEAVSLPDFVVSTRSLAREKPRSARRSGASNIDQGLDVVERMAVWTIGDDWDSDAALRTVLARNDVEWAEWDHPLQIQQAVPPEWPIDDPSLDRQWHLFNTGDTEDALPGADIDAFLAWETTAGSRDTVVAVVDTGVDFFHPDLEDNHWVNPGEIPGNGIDDDGNGFIDDIHGYDFLNDDSDPYDDNNHGTHIAGIVAAIGDNGVGVAGVAWGTRVMALKVFNQSGTGSISTAIEAIDYAVAQGVRLINASWGTAEPSRALRQVIEEARNERDVLVIAAAGNDNGEAPNYPAFFETTLSVASTDNRDQRSTFSNYGPWVDLSAPGTGIFSTLPNNHYGPLNGTSMATPMVSGVAALSLAVNPEFTAEDLVNLLVNAVDPLETEEDIGAGRVNAAKAVAIREPLPTASLELPAELGGEVSIVGSAFGEGFAQYQLEWGPGRHPTIWEPIGSGTNPVVEGALSDVSLSELEEGATYTIRLLVRNQSGSESQDRASFVVENVSLSAPTHSDFLRAGEPVAVQGTVFGAERTYRVEWGAGRRPTRWLTTGITLIDQGQTQVSNDTLAIWDPKALDTPGFYSIRVVATDAENLEEIETAHGIYFDNRFKAGWPQTIAYDPVAEPREAYRSVQAADLDGDGTQELIVSAPGGEEEVPTQIIAFNHDGAERWRASLGVGGARDDIPVIGDLDGDGLLEVYADAGRERLLHSWNHLGEPRGGSWPLSLEAGALGKTIADLNGDGRAELITLSEESLPERTNETRELRILSDAGVTLRRWTLPGCAPEEPTLRIAPAVGPLDSDRELEIVVPYGCSGIARYDWSSQESGPTWWESLSGSVRANPVLGDLDENGQVEIVVAAHDPDERRLGGIHVYTGTGERFGSFPAALSASFLHPPALADLNGDRRLEILAPSSRSRTLHVIGSNGFDLPGWRDLKPLDNVIGAALSVGDLDGDGFPDVGLTEHALYSLFAQGFDGNLGGFRAWNRFAEPLGGIRDGTESLFPFPTGFPERNFPTVFTDLEGDGRLDVVHLTVMDWGFSASNLELPQRKNRASLFVWETDTPFVEERFPWPTYQQNTRHTGYYQLPPKPNEPPVLLAIPNQTTNPEVPFFPIDLDRYVRDADHSDASLAWEWTGLTGLTAALSADRILTIRPASTEFLGTETLLLTVTDPTGATASTTVRFQVTAERVLPQPGEDRFVVAEDGAIDFDVLANDTDPNDSPLSVVALGAPASGQVIIRRDGRVRYTPDENFFGPDSFAYVVSNERDAQSIGLARVDVLPVADPPIAEKDTVATDEDTSVVIHVLENDFDPDGGVPLLVDVEPGGLGAPSIDPQGRVLYEPFENQSGRDRFRYLVRDADGLESFGEITVAIRPVNDAPVATNQRIRMNRNTTESLPFRATDADGDDLTYEIVDGPEDGIVVAFPDVVEYDPNFGYVGADRFTYRAYDGESYSAPATVNVTVLDQNNPPRARSQSLVTLQGQGVDIELTAEDQDEDSIEFLPPTQPAHGRLEGEAERYRYTPDPEFVGTDRFKFRATDGIDEGPAATITIEVTDENSAPEAPDQTIDTRVNQAVEIELEATDPESTPLTYLWVARPTNGTLEGEGPLLTYTPNPDFIGADRFTYRASDGELESRFATVFITVRAPNEPPVAETTTLVVYRDEVSPITLPVSDFDEDPLRSVVVKGPENGLIWGQGVEYFYRPQTGFQGKDQFTFRSWDGQIYSFVTTVELDVRSRPRAPRVRIESIEHRPDGAIALQIRASRGFAVTVESSTDMMNWVPVATRSSDEELWTYVDAAPRNDALFYRARIRP